MTPTNIFISYRAKDPDRHLAREFFDSLKSAGHDPFLAEESIRWGEKWPRRIEEALQQCDYFLLLLSPDAMNSDMVTEEVARVKQIQQSNSGQRPHILPLRVQFGLNEPLNYDLDGYLGRIQQRVWNSSQDTQSVIDDMLRLISTGAAPERTLKSTSDVAIELEGRPPLPVAPPELPEGQVALASIFYIQRLDKEEEFYSNIKIPGSLISIKAPRQMGKTSLMARILNEARKNNYATLPLSLQLVDGKIFANLDLLLPWLCSIVGRSLNLPNKIKERWDDYLTTKDNCTVYFSEYILPNSPTPIVLALDEADRLFDYPEVLEEFFGLLRGWHEAAKNSEIWQKLRVIIVHSTECYVPLDINQSPLENVGLPIRLRELTDPQINQLVALHGLGWGSEQIDKLCELVGGHPYLLRVALYYIARREVPLEEFLQTAPTEEGKYSDHLRRILWKLEQNQLLADAMRLVISANDAVQIDSVVAFKLEGMGLVKRQGNKITTSCQLYKKYLLERLRENK